MANVAIFWDTAPCSSYANRRFGATIRLRLMDRKSGQHETSLTGVSQKRITSIFRVEIQLSKETAFNRCLNRRSAVTWRPYSRSKVSQARNEESPQIQWRMRTDMDRRMASCGMLRHVALIKTDVSEELSASFIRVTKIGELGTTLAITNVGS
jgi:hypothetical protein